MTQSSDTRRRQMLALIQEEIELQEQHLALLLEQRSALIACDREAFAALHASYEELADRLDAQAAKRAAGLPKGGAALKQEIISWPAAAQLQGVYLVERLRDLAQLVQNQSAQNHTLIANDLRLVNFQLDLIVSAIKKGPHYASSGSSQPVQANRLINRTA